MGAKGQRRAKMWSKENSDGHKVGLPEHQEMEKAQADRCHLPPGDIRGERASGYIPVMVPVSLVDSGQEQKGPCLFS